jgi:hypothetical protein
MHWCVISGLLAMIAFTAMSKGISVDWQHRKGYVSQNLQDERLIEKLGGVQTAVVQIWTPIPSDAGVLGNFLSKKEPVIVTIQWTGEKGSRESFADRVARIILQNDPRVQKQDLIQIKIGRSYDLGIASGNDYQNFTHTPAEWQQRVFGSPTAPNTSPVPALADGLASFALEVDRRGVEEDDVQVRE